MIHITYIPSTNNPLGSGHIFWEIFTTYIFSILINVQPVWHNSWRFSSIITNKSLQKYTANRLTKYDHEIVINNYMEWGSLSYKQFLEICNRIDAAKKKYNNILVTLTNVCKIHPDVICNWYNSKFINNDIYNLKLRPMLQKLYFDDHDDTQLDIFAIHIRRGDLAQWCYDVGFTLDYYTEIINIINNILDIPIHIYFEDGFTDRGGGLDKTVKYFNYNDIMILETLKNVKLIKGKPLGKDFETHFNELCRSKFLMVSPSSFPLWASFITNGIVLVDQKNIKARVNLFRYCKDVPNFIVFDNLENKMKEIKNKI